MMRTTRLAIALGALLAALAPAPAGAAPKQGVEASQLRVLESSAGDFAVALAAHRRGDLGAAIHAYGLAIEKDPQFVEALVNLARALADQDLPDEAEKWLDRATALRQDYYAIYKVRGLVALRRGDAAAGVAALEQARALRVDDPEILTNLAAALLAQGRTAEATGHLEAALELDPGNDRAALNLALARDLASDPGRASYHYRRFLELSPAGDALRDAVRRRLELLGGAAISSVGAGPTVGPDGDGGVHHPHTEETSHERD